MAVWAGVLTFAVAAGSAAAQDAARYQNCLGIARSKPDQALESARAWRAQGGGAPADHCAAMAMIELRQYADAGQTLEELAAASQLSPALLPAVWGQAGNAWLLDGRAERAIAAFTAGLQRAPDSADLLIDRGRALAAIEKWPEAIADLDRALSVEPDRLEAYTYRASARRQSGDLPGAGEDVELALALQPDYVVALLERGYLRAALKDAKGARADFLRVRLLEANTPVADAAGRALEELDVRVR